jgi:hypothetical protein
VNYYHIYLADTYTGSGYSALQSLLPNPIYCSSTHCVDYGSGYSSGGDLKRAKQHFYEYMGTPNGDSPFGGAPSSHIELGIVGDIIDHVGAGGVGGILYKKGYTTCASIPSSLSISYEANQVPYSFTMTPGISTIPTGLTGAGTTFEKRFILKKNGTPELVLEFNCSSSLQKVGHVRMYSLNNEDSTSPYYNTAENKEYWYDMPDGGPHTFELYKFEYQPFSTWSRNYTYGKKGVATSTFYKFWYTYAERYLNTSSASEDWRWGRAHGVLSYPSSSNKIYVMTKDVTSVGSSTTPSDTNTAFLPGSVWEALPANTKCGPTSSNTSSGSTHSACTSAYSDMTALTSLPYMILTTAFHVQWMASSNCAIDNLRCKLTTMPSSLLDENQNLGEQLDDIYDYSSGDMGLHSYISPEE